MKHSQELTVVRDQISAAYKVTVIKAIVKMPAEGTLKEWTKYIGARMQAAHPEIAWGVELVK